MLQELKTERLRALSDLTALLDRKPRGKELHLRTISITTRLQRADKQALAYFHEQADVILTSRQSEARQKDALRKLDEKRDEYFAQEAQKQG